MRCLIDLKLSLSVHCTHKFLLSYLFSSLFYPFTIGQIHWKCMIMEKTKKQRSLNDHFYLLCSLSSDYKDYKAFVENILLFFIKVCRNRKFS